jgi:hypothetical protein
MRLKCGKCGKMFTATQQQGYRLRTRRQDKFACSLSCRGAMNILGRIAKYGLKRQSIKKQARGKLNGALLRGVLFRPDVCERCGKRVGKGKIQGHHFAGYENALKVQWICQSCHGEIDSHTKARGERHPRAKLTERDVRDIRQFLLEGDSLQMLADGFGVSKKTIVNIKHNRIWRGL